MIHMLSSFDLRPGESFSALAADYAAFLSDLRAADMIAEAGPLGVRVADTPMDTDVERQHRYYAVMTFRDRAQLDRAYAHIAARRIPGTDSHHNVYRRLTNAVFLCWQDHGPGHAPDADQPPP